MTLGQILFSFDGRIRRSTFWLTGLGMGAAFTVLFMVLMTVGGLGGMMASGGGDGGQVVGGAALAIGGLLMLVAFPVMIWVSLAINVKRWHDRDKSWSWIFISLIPVIGWIWALVEVGFSDGTPGPNRFGPSPKGLGGAAPAYQQPQVLQ